MPPFSKTPEPFDFGSVSRSRSTSMSSDGQLPRINLLLPPPMTPQPAFIASSAAAQIITADQEFNTVDFVADDHDGEGNGDSASALVAPDALSHLNGFLDHLLFNILAVSKSTQLSSIRPAVAEVLKPRLAKEVVSAADDELSEYMGGEGDEHLEFRGGQEPTGDFDLVRSWKRTRLRCMVYTRLGDMEEDEEDEHIVRDGLAETETAPRRFASHVDNITPAAAIFLTSIIEHLGEQALIIAGETARSRLSTKLNLEHDEITESGAERGRIDRLVVEDYDMEKLAMNATLGRLWRTWRKRMRTPNLSRTLSRESFRRRGIASTLANSRKSSVVTIDELPARSVTSFETTEAHEEEIDPAFIPLPMSEHDIKEISIPDFSAEPEGEIQTMEAVVAHKVRPRSLIVLPSPSFPRSRSVASSPVAGPESRLKLNRHARSRSLPNNSYFPLDVVAAQEEAALPVDAGANKQEDVQDIVSPTPSEERRRLETMYEQDESVDPESTGLAISTPTATEFSTKHRYSEGAKTPTARHSIMAPSLSGASVEVEVSRPGSAQTAYLNDETQRGMTEIIEDRGTSRPTSTIQRPRRKASDDSKKSLSASASSASGVPAEVEVPIPTQGTDGDSTDAQKAADDASKADGAKKTIEKTWFVLDDEDDDEEACPAPSVPRRSSADRVGRSSPAFATSNRASVQRVPGQLSMLSKSDSNSEKRPPTAGSSSSQVSNKLKGMVGRSPRGESASPRVRSSSETSRPSSGSRNSPGLDQLIQSDETIHYTLTPKNMRDMEEPDSPRWKANRSSTADLADFLKSTAPPGDLGPKVNSKSPARPVSKFQPIAVASEGLSSPKDAKPVADSTRDFASSVKSSGPDGPASAREATKSPDATSKPTRRFSDATEISKKFIRPGSGLSNSTRNTSGPRLQARSAVAPRGEQTSELIDFIREGPPTPGSHRISRSVAPFRNTMDSDDMNNSASRASGESIPNGSMATKSHTSLGSRTGLLDSSNRANAKSDAPAPTSAPSGGAKAFDDDPMPVRKQRRVRDPYAIDDDDDEELEELLRLEEKPQRKEESLIDFLRSEPPPDLDSTPQPIVTTNVTAPSSKSPSSLTSASAMKARFLRNNTEKSPTSKTSKSSLHSAQTDPRPSGQSDYASKVGMERNGGNKPAAVNVTHGTAMPKRQTDTGDLADFLKNTGPPEPPRAPSAFATSKPKDSNGISRLFVRRKKVEA